MPFKVVETNGRVDPEDDLSAIVTDANSYCSVETFLEYWIDRGIDYSDYEVDVIQANLVKATDYMDRRYAMTFKGTRVDSTQGLAWPRNSVRTRDGAAVAGVPLKVRQACAEYAARSVLGTSLWADPTINRNVKKTVSAIGPIREEVEYVGGGLTSEVFPTADGLLVEYILPAGGVMR